MQQRLLSVALATAIALTLVGCDGSQGVPIPLDEFAETRVVTLAPALTQMLVDLDQAELVVGVAINDFAAPEGIPVVGDYQNIDAEAILALQPTHVLTLSTSAQGVPLHLRELARTHDFTLVAYPYPRTINEVYQILVNLHGDDAALGTDTPSLASMFGRYQETRALRLKVTDFARLAELSRVTTSDRLPRVLMVIGTNPLMAAGQGTVHNELLSSVGALNVVSDPAATAPTFDREMLLAASPDVVVFLLPGAPALGPIEQDERLQALRGLDIPAVANNRIVLINHPLALLPSTSLVRIGALMAKAIHPQLAEQVDQVMQSDPLAGDHDDDEDDGEPALPDAAAGRL